MSKAEDAIKKGKNKRLMKGLITFLIVGGIATAVTLQFTGPYIGWANPYLAKILGEGEEFVERINEEDPEPVAPEVDPDEDADKDKDSDNDKDDNDSDKDKDKDTDSDKDKDTEPVQAFKYDFSEPRKSPKSLEATVKHFYGWLSHQEERVGGQLINKMWAKEYGNKVVLYMIMNNNFSNQDYDLRNTVTKQFHKGWSDRLVSFKKVKSLSRAHIVMLNQKGVVIGGSRESNGGDTWAKR